MKFLILVWCLFFTFYKSSANSLDCSIESLVMYQKTAIGLRSLGDNFIISDLKNTKTISSNGRIYLHCESFSYHRGYYGGIDYESSGSDFVLFCDNGRLSLTVNEESISYDSSLKCENELSFYQVHSNFCNHQALAFGIKIRSVTVVLAEVCYNFDSMKIGYLHYTTHRRNTLLNMQIYHNPNPANASEMINKNKFSFDRQYNYAITVQSNLTMHKPLVKLIDYELSEVVANTNFVGILKHLMQENRLPLVPWWKPLRDGNWITYQQILKTYTRNQNFSVFTGTSHKASYPGNFLCSVDADITYELNSEENNIPLYIWSYVKMRTDVYHPNDVVIIGLNTPFFDASQILCNDKCSEITWVAELEVTRKMPAFGYIFCCDPDEVGTILDGFPKKI